MESAHHDTVADTAHLCALDIELAGFRRFEPTCDDTTGNRILLEAELRNREVVENVFRLEFEVIHCIDFQVEFVDSRDVVSGT